MARKIPPFAALRAFEALARRKTLQAAADELYVSSSAISHQVKSLETFLSAKLFVRISTGLELTPIGKQFLLGLGDALDRIEATTLSVLHNRRKGGLTVHLYQSLAQLWLIPQLSDFLSSNPDISVKMVTGIDEVDLSGTDVDLSICYARSKPCGSNVVEKLIDEVILPVCSPEYLHAYGPIDSPAALVNHRLISSSYEPEEWNIWLAGTGVDTSVVETRLTFDKRSLLLQAASDGLGVAMNRRPYGDLMIKSGILVAPLSLAVRTGYSYYLVAPQRSSILPHVKQFKAWLSSICVSLRDS